ncbi:hypothetical protein C8Q77DRAFT_1110849 [Trametes polyzona]|nr:hypothetical protein C8Q77DRAFT_1110849 [Trametes polyzona]
MWRIRYLQTPPPPQETGPHRDVGSTTRYCVTSLLRQLVRSRLLTLRRGRSSTITPTPSQVKVFSAACADTSRSHPTPFWPTRSQWTESSRHRPPQAVGVVTSAPGSAPQSPCADGLAALSSRTAAKGGDPSRRPGLAAALPRAMQSKGVTLSTPVWRTPSATPAKGGDTASFWSSGGPTAGRPRIQTPRDAETRVRTRLRRPSPRGNCEAQRLCTLPEGKWHGATEHILRDGPCAGSTPASSRRGRDPRVFADPLATMCANTLLDSQLGRAPYHACAIAFGEYAHILSITRPLIFSWHRVVALQAARWTCAWYHTSGLAVGPVSPTV